VCGADRIELCADLAQGGTTPSIGLIRAVAASVEQADVQVIGRPRGGNFVFTDAEIELMAEDVAAIAHVAAQERTSVGISLGSSGWPPKPVGHGSSSVAPCVRPRCAASSRRRGRTRFIHEPRHRRPATTGAWPRIRR